MDIYELAELMHARLCHWDHTEQCAWYYRNKQMTRWVDSWEHKSWLKKAKNLVAKTGLSIDNIAKVVEHIER